MLLSLTTPVAPFLSGSVSAALANPKNVARATDFEFKLDLLAELSYGSFKGAYDETYNISYWQKIPFAAPPTRENRFRAPQAPLKENGTYDSSQTFDMCPQHTGIVVTFYGSAFIQGSACFTVPPSANPIINGSDTPDLFFTYPNYSVNEFGLLP
ncbi:carboxylesterase [Zalerion maritima]|uniref:Carboxylesterase n=1 Tax=Zalerion maritima TaxID=339359 RepID=A0AAD5RQN5_9PEZI|nr:carboxylesterase [Zalerion maritima]